jgi:hypothetical protein
MKKLRVSGHRLDRAYFILDVRNLARGRPSRLSRWLLRNDLGNNFSNNAVNVGSWHFLTDAAL